MRWAHVQYLWLWLLLPVFGYCAVKSERTAQRWLYYFTRQHKRSGRNFLHIALLCGALAAMIAALAEPQVQTARTYSNRSGIALAIGIDVSKSMLAEDVALPLAGQTLFTLPNRLNRARFLAVTLLAELHGEQIGGYIFAEQGIEIVPFTRDYAFCQYILRRMNETAITQPGSNLAEAVNAGIRMLTAAEQKQPVKVLLLLSDGEDLSLEPSALYAAARLAAAQQITVYTIGIGAGKGVFIPIRSADGRFIDNYYRDAEGAYSKTSLRQETLQEIAQLTGGRYFRIDAANVPQELIAAILQDARTVAQTQSVELVWLNIAPIFLLAGVLLFLAGFGAAG